MQKLGFPPKAISANTGWQLYSLLLAFPVTFFLPCCFWMKEPNYWALPVLSISDLLSGYQLGLLYRDSGVGYEFYEPQMGLIMTYWIRNDNLEEKKKWDF